VWSRTGEVSFLPAGSASPDRGTGRFILDDDTDATRLMCVALDDFIADHPAPDAIKCDVEGAELEVVRGAAKLLAARHPWILGEMHSDSNALAWREVLSPFGYQFESIDASHILARY